MVMVVLAIIYGGEYEICASEKRDDIAEYLFYKGVVNFEIGTNLELIRMTKDDMRELEYEKVLLTRHKTGFLCTEEDIEAFEERKERMKTAYWDTLEGLEKISKWFDTKGRMKEKKKIDKAIEVIEKREKDFIGKGAEYAFMKDIVSVTPDVIAEERGMFRDFMYKAYESEDGRRKKGRYYD